MTKKMQVNPNSVVAKLLRPLVEYPHAISDMDTASIAIDLWLAMLESIYTIANSQPEEAIEKIAYLYYGLPGGFDVPDDEPAVENNGRPKQWITKDALATFLGQQVAALVRADKWEDVEALIRYTNERVSANMASIMTAAVTVYRTNDPVDVDEYNFP